jgi:L-threonylcarbamoyladenylate synthase
MPRSSARVYPGSPRDLEYLARRLRAGELVAVPTETVYGLAGNALSAKACAKIFRAKGRPTQDPLIVHIHSLEQLDQLAEPNDVALRLARRFWPGGLTIVLPKKKLVPDIVTAGRDSVAIRMPRHRLFRRLLELAGIPLAAPSANPFGYISPTTAEHVRQNLGSKIRHILDGGAAAVGVESTIIDLRDPGRPAILRPGAVPTRDLETVLGRTLVTRKRIVKSSPAPRGQLAPGMLARHYSPHTPVRLHARLPAARRAAGKPDEAFVYLKRPGASIGANIFWLDPRGDLPGIARNLFATLRRLDAQHFRVIHVERATNRGLGQAINDRLQRAAAR